MKAVVIPHLGLPSPNACPVADVEDWLHGSFNVCIPVTISVKGRQKHSGTRVLLRLPLPYRTGEEFRRGNSDEKIRGEAGTYAWLQENCPDIPIPQLYGFATSDGQTSSSRVLKAKCSHRHGSKDTKSLNIVEHSSVISLEYYSVWLMSLFPRLDPSSSIAMGICNYRPLSLEIQDLENDQVPINMSRCETYSTVSSYFVDLIGNHNNRILHQPNAINHTGDYIYQVSALTKSKLPSHRFSDASWHITCLVDLEWACSRPIEMIRTPTWLTNQACDEIAEDSSEYNKARSEFIDIMANEEVVTGLTSEKTSLSEIMKHSWEAGTFWFSLALASPTGIFSVFYK
ncbi:hypothetical protein N7540_006202 [Penicillium herquei]|nr:hypothetical protein N7540_006202 [Penicillium herquei]